jgi:hypothetical protein
MKQETGLSSKLQSDFQLITRYDNEPRLNHRLRQIKIGDHIHSPCARLFSDHLVNLFDLLLLVDNYVQMSSRHTYS